VCVATLTSLKVDAASGTTGIVVVEERDGDIYVLKAEEKIQATHELLSEYVYQLWHDYAPISKLYIDNASVTFVKTMKQMLGEPSEYMDQIKLYKSMHANYELNMRVQPIFFTVDRKREMLGMLKQCLEEGHLKIHAQKHEKLLLFLHECSDQELIINKLQTAHDDIGDCACMCMLAYERK
jgi:hypothetical protein